MALDAAGNFAVAWAGFGDDAGNGIVVQRFYANGTTNGQPIWVNDHEAGDQIDPLIAMDPEGNFVVAWIDITGYDGSGYGIYYQCFNAQGVRVGVNRLANTYTAGDQTNPALAMDAQGNFLLAWEGSGQEDVNGVYFQLFDNNGNPKTAEQRANVATSFRQSEPAVAFDPSGKFLIAWSSQTVSLSNCFARFYDSMGNPQGGEFALNTACERSQITPHVAFDSQGNYLAAWSSYEKDGSSWGIFGQFFDSDGTVMGTEFRVSTTSLGDQYYSDVAMDAAGNAMISWEGNGLGDSMGLFSQRYLRNASPTGNGGAIGNEGVLTLINCTLSGNEARQQGGGSFNAAGASATITNCTIAFNNARDGGGIRNAAGGVVNTLNTLLAGNAAGGNSPDATGVFTSLGHNLISEIGSATGFNAPGDQTAANAADLLGPLADNGGETNTHALLAGSTAIDAGLNVAGILKDQRGIARPQDYLDNNSNFMDIGAFERYRGEICGKIFRDLENDGVEDANDPGLAGRTVYLDANVNGSFDPYEATAITQADGSYAFAGLLPGSYVVRRIIPLGWETAHQTVNSYPVTLRTGERIASLDFGDYGNPGEIRGTVFDDVNRDNYRQDSELGLPGWTIYIDANDSGDWDAGEISTQTDSAGRYTFDIPIPLGAYILREIPQLDWMQTLPRLVDGSKWTVTVLPGDSLANIDFGNYNTLGTGVGIDGSISGYHFLDTDCDGVKDPGELPAPGWTIYLDMNNNGVLDLGELTSITDADGKYAFTNLGPQVYHVRMVQAVPSRQTTPLGNQFSLLQFKSWGIELPLDIIAADFYGLGRQDILVADCSGDRALLMKNLGEGVFAAPVIINLNFTTGNHSADVPAALAAGDFNRDAKIDFAVANFNTGTISIMLNQGQGSFTSRAGGPISLGDGFALPNSIAVGDFNADNYPDLAVANQGNDKLSILINTTSPQANFTVGSLHLPSGSAPFEIIAAHLNDDNHDGVYNAIDKLDLAVVNSAGDSVTIYLNNGSGGFPVGSTISLDAAPLPPGSDPIHQPCALAAGDLNGDGKPDLAIANYSSNDVSLLINDGFGTFTRQQTRQPAGLNPMSINAADMDGDGKIDLVVTNRGQNLTVLRNNGNLNFSGLDSYGVGNFPDGIAFSAVVLNLNGDSRPDVITANGSNTGNGYVSVLTNSVVAGAYHLSTNGSLNLTNVDFGRFLQTNSPKLDSISSPPNILGDSGQQTINLTGVSPGDGEMPPVMITAASGNPGLIPNPQVNYVSPYTTGSLTYTPVPYQSGTAEITVTVSNGGMDHDLSTILDNMSFIRKFTVVVERINHPPALNEIPNPSRIDQNASQQQISLGGIVAGPGDSGQSLRVTAVSSNPNLIPDPIVIYSSPNAVSTLLYTPVAGQNGQALITVTVTDSGWDLNLNTPEDNLTVIRTFIVNVYYNPTAREDEFTDIFVNSQNNDLDVLANDLCDPHDNLYIWNLELNANGLTNAGGTVTITDNGTRLRYTPTQNFVGIDSLSYWARRIGGTTASLAVVIIHVATHTTHNWDGGGENNLWTTAANWAGDLAPSPGDNLIFPAGVARLDNVNDFPTGTLFGSIAISGDFYQFQNNSIQSSSVTVQGNTQLTAVSIICNTLTIGDSSQAAAASSSETSDAQPSNAEAPLAASTDGANEDGDAIIASTEFVNTIPDYRAESIAASSNTVPTTSESVRIAAVESIEWPAIIDMDAIDLVLPNLDVNTAFISSVIENAAVAELPPEHIIQRHDATRYSQLISQEHFERVLSADKLLTIPFDIYNIGSSSIQSELTDQANDSRYEELANTLVQAKKKSSPAIAVSLSLHTLALESIAEEYAQIVAGGQDTSELISGQFSRLKKRLAKKAVVEPDAFQIIFHPRPAQHISYKHAASAS